MRQVVDLRGVALQLRSAAIDRVEEFYGSRAHSLAAVDINSCSSATRY